MLRVCIGSGLCALLLSAPFLVCIPQPVLAGGGLILRDDVCIITIDFYEAHFTAYQPDTSGNEEFCRDLPNTGETLFVLDYLHRSLKEVPVDFRIIRDVTGLGQFARWEDVQQIEDIESHTVFYRAPVVEAGGSYRVQHDFLEKGDYIGVVTAGHPTNDHLYNAVFPFSVGARRYPFWLLYLLAAGLLVALFRYAYVSMSSTGEK
jgi:hypothetical protein